MKAISTVLLVVLMAVASYAQDSQKAAPPAGKAVDGFEFGGGSLSGFLQAVKEQLGFDLEKIATIPPGMYGAKIPKMRLSTRERRINVTTVLEIYNSLSQKTENSLGQWIVEGLDGSPQTILLDEGGRKHSNFTVKAFAFGGTGRQAEERYEKFSATVHDEMKRLEESQYSGRLSGIAAGDIEGSLAFHGDTQIAVAAGGRVFVELAAAIYDAMRQNIGAMPVTIPTEKTTKP